jgi:hypothetical protein
LLREAVTALRRRAISLREFLHLIGYTR